jgi:hypothetical protein
LRRTVAGSGNQPVIILRRAVALEFELVRRQQKIRPDARSIFLSYFCVNSLLLKTGGERSSHFKAGTLETEEAIAGTVNAMKRLGLPAGSLKRRMLDFTLPERFRRDYSDWQKN